MSFLRSNKFISIINRYKTSLYQSGVKSLINCPKQESSFNFTRTFSVENIEVIDSLDVRQSNSVEEIFEGIEDLHRRSGYVTKSQINRMHSAIESQKTLTPGQSLFLLRCCGNVANNETSAWRRKTVLSILHTFNQIGFKLDISHYNMLLQVNLDNGFNFNPDEILQDLKEKGIEPNRVTYGRLIEQFCRNGDIEGSNKILELMKEKSFPLSEDIFNSLILGNAKCGDLSGAISILDTMKQCQLTPGGRTYAVILQAYAENGDIEGMFKAIADHEEFLFSGKVYLDLLPILARKELSEHIPRVISMLETHRRWEQQANVVLIQLIEQGSVDVAMQLLLAMPLDQRNTGRKHSAVIQKILQSDVTFEKSLEYSKTIYHSGMNAVVFEILLKSLLQKGKLNEASVVLKEMKENGCEYRAHFLHSLRSSQISLENTEELYSFFDTIGELQLPIDLFFISNYVLPALSPSNADDILRLYPRLIRNLNPYNVNGVYSGTVDYLLDGKEYDNAAKFVTNFRRGLPYNQRFRSRVSNMLLTCDKPQNAVAVLRQMLPFNIRNNKMDDGRGDEAERNRPGWEAVGAILCEFIEELQKENTLNQKLVPILEAMKEMSVGIGPNKEDLINSLGSFASADILELLNYLEDPNLRPERTAGGGNIADNLGFFERKIDELKSEGDENIIGLQIKLLNGYAKTNMVEKAEELKMKIEATGEKITNNCTILLAEMYLKNERLEDAEKLLNLFLEDRNEYQINPRIIMQYANALVVADRVDDAIKSVLLLSPQNDETWKFGNELGYSNLNLYVSRLLENLTSKDDLDSLRRLQAALLSKNYGNKRLVLQSSVEHYLQKNDIDGALKEFENIANEHGMTANLRKLTNALIEKNDLDQLQTIVNVGSKLNGEMNTLYDLTFCFLESGKLDQAEKIIKTPGLRTLQDKLDKFCKFSIAVGRLKVVEDLISMTGHLLSIDRGSMYLQLLNGYIQNKDVDKALNVWTKMQEDGVNSSDEFLNKLGNFLRSNGVEPPFSVGSAYTPKEEKTTVVRTRDYGSRSINKEPLNRFDPKHVSEMMESDKSEEFLNEMKEHFVTGKELNRRTLISLMESLVKKGDPETLLWMHKYLVDRPTYRDLGFPYFLGSAYNKANRLEEYFNSVHDKCLESEDDAKQEVVSLSFIMNILSQRKDLKPLVEKCAAAYKAKGNTSIYDHIFYFHLMNNHKKEAEEVYAKYLLDSFLQVNKITTASIKRQDLSIINNMIDILRDNPQESKRRLLGQFYSMKMRFLCKNDKGEEAMQILKVSLDHLAMEHLTHNVLIGVKEMADAKNIPFPYTIPEFVKKSESSSSSSSSSSSDETK